MLENFSQRWRTLLKEMRRKLRKLRSKFVERLTKEPTRLAAKDESRRAHAAEVVDLFATIMAQVEGLSMDDMDTTMDMLRYDFPNVEHSWLAERFQQAYTAEYSLSHTLTIAAADRTTAERTALALEILTMLYRVGGDLTNPSLFDRVANGLNLPGQSRLLEKLVSTPGLLAPAPLEVLRFSRDIAYANVTLSQQDDGVRFRAISCANILLIVNDARQSIVVHGRTLHKGDMQIISPGQTVELNGGRLRYSVIRSLIQTQYSKADLAAFLHCENDEVYVSRYRHKNCIAKLQFGVHVEIEVLNKDAEIIIDGLQLSQDCAVCTSYFSPFTVNGLGPYHFAELHQIESPSKSYQLAPDSRKILVTNLPYVNKMGALMLTPGLAPGVVFEVSYSRVSNTGLIKFIEGSRHSISINGAPIKEGEATLADGDLIALGSLQFLRCRFTAGVLDEETSLINELTVKGLTRDFVRSGRVVDNIDFTLKRGEMACILGPSGSGKSTLLNMLAGHLAPSFGSIHYNDERLTPQSSSLRRHIAFIPREDILDEAMTVGEHVYQASVARRPRLTFADRMRRVQAVLNFVGLSHLIERRVGKKGERTLSDGERTRLNLALDLTATSEVFLIDEPISGLASSDAEYVIDTLSNMAAGRIVVCSLHRPSQSILNQFSKVMVLNDCGQMAFWGTPSEMQAYFQTAARELGLPISREARAAGGAEYAFEVMSAPFKRLGKNRLHNSSLWQERFEKHRYNKARVAVVAEDKEQRSIPQVPRRSVIELWRLFKLWLLRTFIGRIRSRMSLYALLLESPVLALLIAGTLRSSSSESYIFYHSLHISEYLFLSLVLAMFFGLTDSACEIIRDRNLIRRESNYQLFIPGYLLSKVIVLTGIAALQCALYLWVSNAILEIQSLFWPHFGIMVLTAFIGISLSLMVSSLVRSERTALNIVPLLLVPQILLAGALIRFEEMNEFCPETPALPACIEEPLSSFRHRVAYQDKETHEISSKPIPLIAELCPLRYAFEMMFVTQAHHNLWDIEYQRIEDKRQALRDETEALKQALKSNRSKAKVSQFAELNNHLRLVNNAALLLNSAAINTDDARDILRLSRKTARTLNYELLQIVSEKIENRDDSQGYAVEFYFTNQKIVEMREGVNLARKDNRISENRGFFLAPRQPVPFRGMNQQTEEGSISTLARNAFYLLLMGICPILVTAWRLRRICVSG